MTQFTKENSLLIPIENEYIYGKYEGPLVHYYRLKVNKKKEIMKIILSFNSDRLNWAINNQASTNNSTNYAINTKKERGKIIITLNTKNEDSIYLNIFNYDNNSYLPLQNYVFKSLDSLKEGGNQIYSKMSKNVWNGANGGTTLSSNICL